MNLFEVLVTLAIISAVTGVVLSGRLSEQPGLQLQKAISEVKSEASTHRHKAVTEGKTMRMQLDNVGCPGGGTSIELLFFSDGTARGDELCLARGELSAKLKLDPLTGRLVRVY